MTKIFKKVLLVHCSTNSLRILPSARVFFTILSLLVGFVQVIFAQETNEVYDPGTQTWLVGTGMNKPQIITENMRIKPVRVGSPEVESAGILSYSSLRSSQFERIFFWNANNHSIGWIENSTHSGTITRTLYFKGRYLVIAERENDVLIEDDTGNWMHAVVDYDVQKWILDPNAAEFLKAHKQDIALIGHVLDDFETVSRHSTKGPKVLKDSEAERTQIYTKEYLAETRAPACSAFYPCSSARFAVWKNVACYDATADTNVCCWNTACIGCCKHSPSGDLACDCNCYSGDMFCLCRRWGAPCIE